MPNLKTPPRYKVEFDGSTYKIRDAIADVRVLGLEYATEESALKRAAAMNRSRRQGASVERSLRKRKLARLCEVREKKDNGICWSKYGKANPDPPPDVQGSIPRWGLKIKVRRKS